MTLPVTDTTPAYTDLAGLDALKRGAASQDPAAIRKVAEQFESMFTRMMLKSMRDAVGTDPMFGSDQQQMYQGMADDQLSVQLSKGKGLGLADMLVRQLQKMGVPGAGADKNKAAGGLAIGSASATGTTASASGMSRYSASGAAAAYAATQRGAANQAPASSAAQASFVAAIWPHAQAASQQLGVDPRNLVAQAALETNWGRNVPQDSSGSSSNNLFGIKASGDWSGATVTADTQ
jgi:peptidoglycan hydrolase FlgJ